MTYTKKIEPASNKAVKPDLTGAFLSAWASARTPGARKTALWLALHTGTPRKEEGNGPVTERKTNGFKKFMVMTSVLAALGGAPTPLQAGVNPVFFMRSSDKKTEETVKTPPAEQKEDNNTAIQGSIILAVALMLAMVVAILSNSGRPCGPWGTDLRQWNKHLADLKRRQENKQKTENPST